MVNIIEAHLSSVVIWISLMRQAIIMPRVVLPLPIWSEKMQGVEAGSFFSISTMMSKHSSPGALSSFTGHLWFTRLGKPFSFMES